jgi:hypothetical protein
MEGDRGMNAHLAYDKDLQMFIEPSAQLNVQKLRFLRWLAERGMLEHEIFGTASGPLADMIGALPSAA